MAAACGSGSRRHHETAFAVLDFETTDLHPGNDGIVLVGHFATAKTLASQLSTAYLPLSR